MEEEVKKCEKCGGPLDENGKCPVCDAAPAAEAPAEEAPAEEKPAEEGFLGFIKSESLFILLYPVS